MTDRGEESLGQVIRRRRAELGLTQEALAERIGPSVRQAEISRLENDRVTLPRRARLQLIADALELPIGVLLERSGWTGAEHVFDPVPEEDLPAPLPSRTDPHIVMQEMALHHPAEAFYRSELSEAISRSTMLVRETEVLMLRVNESIRRMQAGRPAGATVRLPPPATDATTDTGE